MPLIRKIITVGHSKAVTIPDAWLKYHEAKRGSLPTTLLMEVNDDITLKIEEEHEPEPATRTEEKTPRESVVP